MTIKDHKDIITGSPAQIVRQMRYKDAGQYKFNFLYMRSVAKRFKMVHDRPLIYTNALSWLQALADAKEIKILTR